VVARGILVDLLVADGRLDEARPLAEEAARIAPVYAPAHYDLGRLRYLEAQALERAGADPARVAALREAALPELAAGLRLANEPETAFRSGFAAGSALSELGRPAEAAGSFEAALAARPERPPAGTEAAAWWWRCQRGLVAALAARGDRVRAAALIDELRRRYPGDPEAASLGSILGP
jgi:tetratricopeptide (TPR) repeat protein